MYVNDMVFVMMLHISVRSFCYFKFSSVYYCTTISYA